MLGLSIRCPWDFDHFVDVDVSRDGDDSGVDDALDVAALHSCGSVAQ